MGRCSKQSVPLENPLAARVSRRRLVQGAVAAPVFGAVVLGAPRRVFAQGETVRIGSKDFTEEFILGELYGLLLENAGIAVDTSKINLGGTGIAHAALVNDEIDIYPEYTGTALSEVLGVSFDDFKAQLGGEASPVAGAAASPAATVDLAQAVYEFVAAGELEQNNIVLLDKTAFNDTQSIAVTKELADQNGLTTISQLAAIAADLTIVAPSDAIEREDGILGLQRVYGGGFADIEVLGVQPGLRYQAIESGDAQVVLSFSTEPQIVTDNLVLLQDDLNLWPPYNAAPFVRKETLDANPGIADALNPIAPLLTNEVMSTLIGKVDIDGGEPKDVAEAWLKETGLLPA